MDSEDEIERKHRERHDPKITKANVTRHEMTLDELKIDLRKWEAELTTDPNNENIKDRIKQTEQEIGNEYARLREADARNQRAQRLLTDRQAEMAMLMDDNGIDRDKSDPEFEHRVMMRREQNSK